MGGRILERIKKLINRALADSVGEITPLGCAAIAIQKLKLLLAFVVCAFHQNSKFEANIEALNCTKLFYFEQIFTVILRR